MYSEKELNDLEQFFGTVELPEEIEVMQAQKVIDVQKFIKNHLACARANIGKNTFSSFYERLVKLKELLLRN
ncbi:DUF6965 family protein [Longitalea luteola]|uniref:DUF6965 family protein n=1 Tax=Longitalea luteola TaxID=2812563 RepID=UPI001A966044|nr:hypothetical protein [Longitalea luteola]